MDWFVIARAEKMSKSLGNGIDPMDVIEDHGADALRFFLTTNSTPGLDLRLMKRRWNQVGTLSIRFGMQLVMYRCRLVIQNQL